MTIEFSVSAVIPASHEAIYDAWLDTDGHTKMTGSPAHATANVGDPFDAWDGYISGKNLELETGIRIVQSWRATSYKDSDGDSQIEVSLEPVEGQQFPVTARTISFRGNRPASSAGVS